MMRNDTKRVVVIGLALLAVAGSLFAAEKYQTRRQVKYCKESAIIALSDYVRADEYKTAVNDSKVRWNASLREMTDDKELHKFDGLLASFQIEDEFTVQKYRECQARFRSEK
jgi:hypothetical protein